MVCKLSRSEIYSKLNKKQLMIADKLEPLEAYDNFNPKFH